MIKKNFTSKVCVTVKLQCDIPALHPPRAPRLPRRILQWRRSPHRFGPTEAGRLMWTKARPPDTLLHRHSFWTPGKCLPPPETSMPWETPPGPEGGIRQLEQVPGWRRKKFTWRQTRGKKRKGWEQTFKSTLEGLGQICGIWTDSSTTKPTS